MLSSLGIRFEVVAADLDETILAGESADSMVQRLASAKAQAIARRFPAAWILAADTTVVLDQVILGKPSDAADAGAMLNKLSAREHIVLSAFSIINLDRGVSHTETHQSKVRMAAMSRALIADYVATGEPLDKAGAYAIQGLGAALVEGIEGSYTNVVGLNLSALVEALRRYGCLQ